ncbi:thiamine phosphate synthase [Pontivivens insulae]|uniref:Thiamine-phosphate synthase n=1 Tax=Pontivivens insulae TaxID=1639689 RepID=A0A2R8ADU7_9RHOB|nr:thiamine phosphate synthase [Pontivivens insulae]RED14159.1 thiamine-phosphate pyrophosphorylase [Pontivivens insulae]SPF30235.1 Thiamine-phosphate synthase [Pontivivens insulae]
MAETEQPQLYLVTPDRFELSTFKTQLEAVLAAHDVACVRLALASTDAAEIGRAADGLRDMCHARDVALVITDHWRLVRHHGLDGVHLTDGTRSLRDARADLGSDAIVGCYCENSRHAGMNAGEAGADYVAFGPMTPDPLLGKGEVADAELFQWWSQMIEVPVVAEGGLTRETIVSLRDHTDFWAVGREIWASDDPATALADLIA